MPETNGTRQDAYEQVTAAVVEALERGTVPWHQPWKAPSDMPTSLSTRRSYRGVNTFLLTMVEQAHCYESKWWGTYRQIGELGGQVRRGEKATRVVFWKFLDKVGADGSPVTGPTGKPERVPMLRTFSVFNSCQADGLTLPAEPVGSDDVDPIDTAEAAAARYLADGGPSFQQRGDQAFYAPAMDVVRVPERRYFDTTERYYSTLFHELTHSTGHAKRLGRPALLEHHYFGDESYSREELVAEMGAAMTCAMVGIEQVTVPQSAAYIASWLKVLREDPRAVVVAAGQAQKAADMILGTEPPNTD